MAELDPTLVLRDLSRAMMATRAWLSLRRANPAEAEHRDPLGATRWVTQRHTFLTLREKVGDPATPYVTGWVLRLLYLRVNAQADLEALTAREARGVRITIPRPAELSFRHTVKRMLAEPSREVRAELGAAAVRGAGEIGGRERDAWARRGELAKRLGLSEADELRTPLPSAELARIALSVLDATDDLARHAMPSARRFTDVLETASAVDPPLPWPARLSMRAVAELFRGEAGWMDVPDLSLGEAPPALSPSTYGRAMARFGARWADAAASRTLAPPLAHAPSELPRLTLGTLVASLLLSESFLRRTFGFSRAEAEKAARSLSAAGLVAARLSAARVLLRVPALAGDGRGVREAADVHLSRALRAPFPVELALVLPRLTDTDPARLLAFGEAALLANELRERHDDDWFRNPKALLSLRDRLGRAPTLELPKAEAERGVVALGRMLGARLG